jgi:hypothetical protein
MSLPLFRRCKFPPFHKIIILALSTAWAAADISDDLLLQHYAAQHLLVNVACSAILHATHLSEKLLKTL